MEQENQCTEHRNGRHRVVKGGTKIEGWTRCVASNEFGPCKNSEAHGGVTYRDTCRCGARRLTEANGQALVKGEWRS